MLCPCLSTDSAVAPASQPTPNSTPGGTAVAIVTKFANTAEQFKAQQAAFITAMAKALSVPPLQVCLLLTAAGWYRETVSFWLLLLESRGSQG